MHLSYIGTRPSEAGPSFLIFLLFAGVTGGDVRVPRESVPYLSKTASIRASSSPPLVLPTEPQ